MKPCVIVVRDNVVDIAIKCNTSEEAEKLFLEKCGELLSNWSEYSLSDIAAILDDGYEKFGNGSICLTWI